ncbi:Nidogen-2 [Bagarius yarrelli]|uniref:Nidogen-2 n=1 Tax=Bagarius yarrelli TaxID=175774 RepID=A0A556TUM5_BAGYA|nr:Nidogen-2 [Bagarius yarrelli]
MWTKAATVLLQLSYIWQHVSALQRGDLFPYGPHSGDLTLQEGDDETSQVIALSKPLHFYDTSFSKLYVATNGIISPHDLPMEKQYVDDGFPTEFPVIAPFLADIDTSNGKGSIYYRQTESPAVLNRVAAEVQKGFPDTRFTPTHAIIATWENVAAYREDTRTGHESSRQVNTFQAVVAYDEEDTYALFLYPEDGLQFFGTRPKEMFNVEIELPARVGFTRGEISYLFFTRTEGPYFSITSNEQSVKNLYQTGNTDVPGIWLFHIGNAYSFFNVIPAEASARLPTALPQKQAFQTTPDYPPGEYETDEESFDEEPEYSIDRDFPNPDTTEFPQPGHNASQMSHQNQDADSNLSFFDPFEAEVTLIPDPQTDRTASTNVPSEEVVDSVQPGPEQTLLEAYPIHPEGEVVNVDEEVNFDTGVIHYSTENKETCDRFQQTCSQNAYCADYLSGFCCHCRAGFYGNGRHCLPDGAPQRVNGKVNGMVSVGLTPVGMDNIDLHAYIVVGDGRAYTAISEVPEPLGWALMPVTPIGSLFGWLFALKLPNSHNGFNITGAEFTRHADVTFYPGNQRLTIVQTGRGLDSQNYLNVENSSGGQCAVRSTRCQHPDGTFFRDLPVLPITNMVIAVITSSSVREFTIVSAQNGAEKFTFQLRQNITYKDCRHAPNIGPETLQLNVERMFAMYVKEERVLRYAITNKIGHVGDYSPDPVQGNPCYVGSHDCDTTAQCVPGEGQHFTCVCATGYTGDGRNCYDVDECSEGLSSCGSHAQCVNLPGSHSCQCQSGLEYGHDSRSCIDVDECQRNPCHHHASCTNFLGSFYCQCQPGFHGDGLQCHRQHVAVPTQRPKTVCERWQASLMERYGGQPGPEHFLPQCDASGEFTPVQCYGETSYCWCVNRDGQEVLGTRSHDKVKPACIPTVAPPTMRPLPRPDVTPPPSGTTLLYAQGQQIGALPLNGTRMDKDRSSVLLALHGSIVVGIDYDCRERKVYWTDLAGRTISRAALEPGSEPEILINSGLMSPEGLAVDQARRRMFWVDSTPDKIETAKLDGTDRRVLFSTDLVNPRAIVVDSLSGTLYWTDWNREAPKIESSTVEGQNRRVLVRDGTKRLECIAADGTGRRVIHGELNYPFSMVFYANHFYYTDWRRDGVIGLSRDSSRFTITDEYLPDQRSHLYGITVAPSSCL